jgi:predicted P-loop ATPase
MTTTPTQELLTPRVRNFASAAEAAAWYISLGFFPIPIPFREKNPGVTGWEQWRIDATRVSAHFNGTPQNIGALMGISTLGTLGLVDIDLDAVESLSIATQYLPATGFIFGRASKPASHWLYFVDPPLEIRQFKDPTLAASSLKEERKKAMVLELRGITKKGTVGLQSVLPGSTHKESGEPITFEPGHDSTPTTVAPTDLTMVVPVIAAGALLARYWPASGRHDTMLSLAGALARSEWALDKALRFCRVLYEAVPTHDPNALTRIDSEVRDSFEKVAAGEPATGFPSLTEHIDRVVVETAFDWLGLKPQPKPRIAAVAVAVPGQNWTKQLLVTEAGIVKPLLANVLLILRNAPEWSDVLSYNEFSLCTVTGKPAPWSQSVAGASWTDVDDSRLCSWLQNYGVAVKTHDAAEAAETIAQENPFHPVKDYLDSLSWDQTARIDTWLTAYCGVEDSIYSRAIASRWLTSAVARIFRPGCQADAVLLLEGPQGSLKSSSLRTLAGDEWFSDCISELGSKDSRLELYGRWIIEIGELDRIRRGDLERVKGFLSTRFDSFRPPYGRRTATFPRSCVFAGTTNDASSFTDETGNRRFWPVRVGKIDLAALQRDREQIWAEALVLFRDGAPWWLETAELNTVATQEQDKRYLPGIWDEQILNWCDDPQPRAKRIDDRVAGDGLELPFDSSHDGVTVYDVLVHGLGKSLDKFTPHDVAQVSRCLTHAGWTPVPRCRVKGSERRVRLYVRPELAGVTL